MARNARFVNDARELACGIESLRISGEIPNPGQWPKGCLLLVNHYHRPGFHSWWIALAVSAAFPGELHWAMTDTFTYPDRFRSAAVTPLSTWFLKRIARMYGFTSMPPMPPRPEDRAGRGIAVRKLLRYARENHHPAIALAPEGRDSPDGTLLDPPPGAGKLVAFLANEGLAVIPAGIFERNGALHIHFGSPIELPAGLPVRSHAFDTQVARQMMSAIARCLPVELHSGSIFPPDDQEVEPCSELRFGN